MGYVEPGFAGIRSNAGSTLHGSAFYIPEDEAKALDRQEGNYDVLPSKFQTYDGKISIGDVGLYVPRQRNNNNNNNNNKEGIPSLRYLKLLREGAREGGLPEDWIQHLDSFPHYVTPPDIRAQTKKWISQFNDDDSRKNVLWTAEE